MRRLTSPHLGGKKTAKRGPQHHDERAHPFAQCFSLSSVGAKEAGRALKIYRQEKSRKENEAFGKRSTRKTEYLFS